MKQSEVLIKVRNYHTDSHMHVNHARYLEFFEEGSWDFLEKNSQVRKMFESLINKGIFHVVVAINCSYRSSAVIGNILRLETQLVRLSTKSYTWSKKIYINNTDKLVVDAEITCVFINSASGDVVPISKKMSEVLSEQIE
ncbi:MAG: acyl-CoA thioesterase [Deltaproteobacteria bacterium]|uniref:acyl-CoA thioesterase n=1 Tax=Desulfobacula sp. TaxID=2593537 RepID=UPI0019A021F7|nr:acyl-CoA thioesterase [Candidatus Desulfobacula maris]MBL6993632.1 acyl-CoA thioesterase [Desulfobacula sp.]